MELPSHTSALTVTRSAPLDHRRPAAALSPTVFAAPAERLAPPPSPRRHLRLMTAEAAQPSPDVAQRIERAAELIQAEYSRPLKLAELAAVAGMSEFHFARVFRAVIGMPPHRYLIAVRLDEALRRLETGESVTNAAYRVGFSSPSHFATAFRRQFGVVPSAFTTRRSRVVRRGPARRKPDPRPAATGT